MKKIVEVEAGLEALIGKRVLIMTSGFFYSGTLSGVNSSCVELENPAIVYSTGGHDASSFDDEQPLPEDVWYVQASSIESFGATDR